MRIVKIFNTEMEEFNFALNNLDSIKDSCRLCLKFNSNIHQIFSKDGVCSENRMASDLSSTIYECTKIKVFQNDATVGICYTCIKELISVLRFQRMCRKVDRFLRQNTGSSVLTEDNFDDENETPSLIDFIDFEDHFQVDPVGITNLVENIANNETIESDCNVDADNFWFDQFPESTTSNNPLESDDELSHVLDCNYKSKVETNLKNDQSKSDSDYPKLTKRDIMVKKAYHGLCHICGREYRHLWVHFQSHEEQSSDTCDICGKGFKSKANLQLHILTHKQAEHPCDLCGKKYRTKMRLKRHMRVHTGERPFQCEICQKRFYTKYNLDVHNRIHTGEKPYSCEICSESFTHSYALKHHSDKCRTKSDIQL